MLAATDIKKMTMTERLQAMELLWKSLSADLPKSVVSPAWHGKVLARRRAKVEAGKGIFLTVQQLKERLDKKRP
jgi:hypothetical protein